MRELWPDPDPDVVIADRLAADGRPKPAGRPWLTLVMISSIDGGITVDGVSGALGGPADQMRFVAARRQADAIVVGAATVAAEDYRPTPNLLAIVSGSLSPDPAARVFGDPTRKPVLYTTTQAARTRGSDFDGIAEVVALGDSISPIDVLADLDGRGVGRALLEGGPSLNGLFLDADLVDEMLWSVSPLITGGAGPRLSGGTDLTDPRRFRVDRVLLQDDIVFVRYLRAEPSSQGG